MRYRQRIAFNLPNQVSQPDDLLWRQSSETGGWTFAPLIDYHSIIFNRFRLGVVRSGPGGCELCEH
jgi:hypothetical protein